MDNLIGDTFGKIGINLIILVLIGAAAYMIIYYIVFKISSSKELANLLGGIAMLAALYFAFMNVYLPAIQEAML